MKRKIKKQFKLEDEINFAVEPPWRAAKNKSEAYQQGRSDGYNEGTSSTKEKEELERRKSSVEVEVLRQIGQAGTSVVECMTKALLSFNRNL